MELLKIPEDILVRILEYMKEADLISLMRTCRYIHHLVAQSPKLMCNLTFHWTIDQNRSVVQKSIRRYMYMIMNLNGNSYRKSVTKPVEKFASSLKRIRICNNIIKARDVQTIVTHLAATNKLESIKFNCIHYYDIDSNNVYAAVQLKSLTELFFERADCRILKHFHGVQLFRFTLTSSVRCRSHPGVCTNFLRTQKRLEILTLSSPFVQDVFNIDVSDIFEFRLISIEFSIENITDKVAKNINLFILKQAVSLINLKVIIEDVPNLQIIATILTNVKVENIILNLELLILYNQFLLGHFRNVTMLVLNSSDVPTAENIFAIKTLENLIEVNLFEMEMNQILFDTLHNLPKLRKVLIVKPLKSFPAALSQVIWFGFYCMKFSDILNYLMINKQTVNLTVSFGNYLHASELKKILIECKNLKEIDFSDCDRIDRACIATISKFGGNLSSILLPRIMRCKRNVKKESEAVANINFN